MNKAELIEKLAEKFDGSKAEAARALNAVTETVTYSLAGGEKVSITGFGVFEKIQRSARMVRNPRTGERKRAKATAVPKFRAGTDLKAYVSGEKKVPRATKASAATKAASTTKRATTSAAKSTTAAKSTPAKRTTAATAKKAPAAPKTAVKKTAAATKTAATRTAAKKTTAKKTAAK